MSGLTRGINPQTGTTSNSALKFAHRVGADLLIWHADLAHGGAPITKPGRSRRSLVAHFCAEADEPYYRRHSQTKELATDECVFVSAFADVR